MQLIEQELSTRTHANSTGRWQLVLMLLFAVALGTSQRDGISILAPMFGEELKLAFADIGYVFATFRLASTAGFLLMAVFIWREKSWVGYTVLGLLGVFGALLTGLASGAHGLIVASSIAGLACGGLLVGAYRIVGGWLSRESHGLAIGLIFALTQSFAPLMPVIAGETVILIGWRWSSYVVAGLWCVWVPLWIWLSFRSGGSSRRELQRSMTLAQMFKEPVTWGVVVGISFATPLSSFQLGEILGQTRELVTADRHLAGWEFALIALLPAMGAVGAGLASDVLIRKGWSADRSRSVVITLSAVIMAIPALFVFVSDPVMNFLFAILSATAAQGLFTVLYTALVDAVPRRDIILGVALSGWLSGLMGGAASMLTKPIGSRWGSTPLLIGFSTLALIAVPFVRALIRRMPAELIPS